MTKESSKIIATLTKSALTTEKAERYLSIPHKGARRALCLRAIRKTYSTWLDAEITKGLKKINLESVPIRENGKIIGYL